LRNWQFFKAHPEL